MDNRKMLWSILGVLFLICIALWVLLPTPPKTPPPVKVPVTFDVTYHIESSNGASVTLQNEGGGTEQFDIASGVWTKKMVSRPGDFLYISAQSTSDSDFAKITCKIFVDLVEVKVSTSEGAYKIASCSLGLPR